MFDLSSYNTFGLHVQAKEGIVVSSVADLKRIQSDRVIILGRGSDVLFTDDYSGTVLINQIKSLSVEHEGDKVIVKAGAGLELDQLIESLIEKGIYGLENLSAIPGTVGAAPIQNVGAYGVEIGDLIKEVSVYDLQRHIQETFTRQMCQFGYRSSYFKTNRSRPLVITQVVFELSEQFSPKLTYRGLSEEKFDSALSLRNKIVSMRRAKLPDPNVVGNAGSFFKNPFVNQDVIEKLKAKYDRIPVFEAEDGMYKLAAGWLIEKAGCRGITHGNVGTWEHQALVIVNRGNAKPHEIVALAKYIKAEVLNKFGIELEPEVRAYDSLGEVSWDSL
ncbi:MAG: UDP-N-acetylmuramate dehydrogenase [Succinivibrio sp.]